MTESQAWRLYILVFPSGKSYVGMTKHDLRKRLRHHIYAARNGLNMLVSKAIRKYGEGSFVAKTLALGSETYIRDLEIRAITAFGTRMPNGYNIAPGGLGGPGLFGDMNPSKRPEVRALLSSMKRGVPLPNMCGDRNPSKRPDVRAKIIAANTGRKHSKESKEKIRAFRIGTRLSDATKAKIAATSAGRVMSAESRAKNSLSNRGQKRSPETCARLSAKALARTPPSEATRLKMALAQLGRRHSPETLAKCSLARRVYWQKRKEMVVHV